MSRRWIGGEFILAKHLCTHGCSSPLSEEMIGLWNKRKVPHTEEKAFYLTQDTLFAYAYDHLNSFKIKSITRILS